MLTFVDDDHSKPLLSWILTRLETLSSQDVDIYNFDAQDGMSNFVSIFRG